MKLKRFDPISTPSPRDNKPRIGVSNTGVWRANKQAGDMLKLKTGSQMLMLQDEKEPTNWYLAPVKSGGFPVYSKDNAFFWSSQVTKKSLMASLEVEHPSGSMLLGSEPTKHDGLLLYPLITSTLVYQPRRSKS